MTDTEIFEDIKRIIQKQFDVSESDIEEESYFDENLHISELDMEDFISALETKYDLIIKDEVVSQFNQVSDLVTYLYEKLSQTS